MLAGYAYTSGSVSFPPPVPIENGKLGFHGAVLAYARSLDIWGRSAKIDIILRASISGEADFLENPAARKRVLCLFLLTRLGLKSNGEISLRSNILQLSQFEIYHTFPRRPAWA